VSVPGTLLFPAAPNDLPALFEVENNASTALTLAFSAGSTTATVTSTALFPATGSFTVCDAVGAPLEVVYYTGKTGTTFTGCVRGREGTTDATRASGLTVEQRVTAGHHETLAGAIIALETVADVTGGYVRRRTGSAATITIAANDASARAKAQADYLCDGTADEVQINAAIAALPARGGKVLLSEGMFSLSTPVVINRDHVILEGMGAGTPAGSSFSSGGDAGDPSVSGGPTVLQLASGFTGSYAVDTTYSASTRVTYGIELRNFGINGISAVATVTGIKWTPVRGAIFNVFVQYMTGDGLYSTLTGDSSVGNDTPYDSSFVLLRIRNCTGHGAVFDQVSSDHIWESCFIDHCGGTGVKLYGALGASSAHQLHGCYIYSNLKGIDAGGGTWNLKVYDCRIQDHQQGGIYLAPGAGDGAAFEIVGGNCRNNSVAADNTYDGINIAPTGAVYGGLILGVDFCADSGLDNAALTKQRYGINVVNSNMNDLVIGPCSASHKTATATFGTGFINDVGTNTRILAGDRIQLIRDGASLGDVRTAYGTGFYPFISGRAARGTVATPLRTKSGDSLFRLGALGASAVDDVTTAGLGAPNSSERARIDFVAVEDWTAAAQGSAIIFRTTTQTGLTLNEMARFVGNQGLDFSVGAATAWAIRMKNNVPAVSAKNAANSATVDMLKLNASDKAELMADTVVATGKTLTGETLIATVGVRTQHVAAATPTGGASGDIRIGDGLIWVNDNGTWKAVRLVANITRIQVSISQGAAGTTVLLAADASNKIKILNYALVGDAACTARFNDGTADLTGAMSFATNGGIEEPGDGMGSLAETGAINRPLNLITTGGAVKGRITLYKEP
jgi:hypothetical protein